MILHNGTRTRTYLIKLIFLTTYNGDIILHTHTPTPVFYVFNTREKSHVSIIISELNDIRNKCTA